MIQVIQKLEINNLDLSTFKHKCSYILFLIKHKNRSIILKIEQTTTVYPQCKRWASYHVTKHEMISTDVIPK